MAKRRKKTRLLNEILRKYVIRCILGTLKFNIYEVRTNSAASFKRKNKMADSSSVEKFLSSFITLSSDKIVE